MKGLINREKNMLAVHKKQNREIKTIYWILSRSDRICNLNQTNTNLSNVIKQDKDYKAHQTEDLVLILWKSKQPRFTSIYHNYNNKLNKK